MRYKVRATHSPNWHKYKDGIFAISVGKKYHEGDKFYSTIHWAATHFDRLHIIVADTLQRHNLPLPNAEEIALAEGSLWLARHITEFESTEKLASVVRWNDILQHKDYQPVLEQFNYAAAKNGLLNNAINADIARFLARQQYVDSHSAERSRKYLLEELAGVTLHARTQEGARIYPRRNLESFKLIEARLVPEAPTGMERQQRIALNFEKRKMTAPQSTPVFLNTASTKSDAIQSSH